MVERIGHINSYFSKEVFISFDGTFKNHRINQSRYLNIYKILALKKHKPDRAVLFLYLKILLPI
jgi:hypothetical protein